MPNEIEQKIRAAYDKGGPTCSLFFDNMKDAFGARNYVGHTLKYVATVSGGIFGGIRCYVVKIQL